jgi:hypothetical protein
VLVEYVALSLFSKSPIYILRTKDKDVNVTSDLFFPRAFALWQDGFAHPDTDIPEQNEPNAPYLLV